MGPLFSPLSRSLHSQISSPPPPACSHPRSPLPLSDTTLRRDLRPLRVSGRTVAVSLLVLLCHRPQLCRWIMQGPCPRVMSDFDCEADAIWSTGTKSMSTVSCGSSCVLLTLVYLLKYNFCDSADLNGRNKIILMVLTWSFNRDCAGSTWFQLAQRFKPLEQSSGLNCLSRTSYALYPLMHCNT